MCYEELLNKIRNLLIKMTKDCVKNVELVQNFLVETDMRADELFDILCINRFDEKQCMLAIKTFNLEDENEMVLANENIRDAFRNYSLEFVKEIIIILKSKGFDINSINVCGESILGAAFLSDNNLYNIAQFYSFLEPLGFNINNEEIKHRLHQYDKFHILGKQKFAEVLDFNIIQKEMPKEIKQNGTILNNKKYLSSNAIGRERELENLILSLAQDKKCPLLVGESGVGKTTIVDELVYKIQEKQVPKFLSGQIIYELKTNNLVAGSRYRGDFEEKAKKVIEYCIKNNIIIFIDEIHTIYGAGSAQDQPNDLACIIKSYIDRDNLKIIGTTTTQEYHKCFANDALKRRFDKLIVEEPEKDMLIQIITKIINDNSLKFGILSEKILNQYSNIVNILIELTTKKNRNYDDTINNPDLVVSIIDKAFAYAKVSDSENLEIDHFIKSIELCDRVYNSAKEKAIKKLNELKIEEIKTYQKILEFIPQKNKMSL